VPFRDTSGARSGTETRFGVVRSALGLLRVSNQRQWAFAREGCKSNASCSGILSSKIDMPLTIGSLFGWPFERVKRRARVMTRVHRTNSRHTNNDRCRMLAPPSPTCAPSGQQPRRSFKPSAGRLHVTRQGRRIAVAPTWTLSRCCASERMPGASRALLVAHCKVGGGIPH
jgi:hypothetical protein